MEIAIIKKATRHFFIGSNCLPPDKVFFFFLDGINNLLLKTFKTNKNKKIKKLNKKSANFTFRVKIYSNLVAKYIYRYTRYP